MSTELENLRVKISEVIMQNGAVNHDQLLLPPASEGCGKVIFSVCPHLRGGGDTPSQVSGRGVPHLRSEVGGTPSQVRGVPHVWGGGTPSQGVPHACEVPHVWAGTPCLGGGGYPMSGGGYPISPPPHCAEQHSEHLLRGGRCASCVHAGGLSCVHISSCKSTTNSI